MQEALDLTHHEADSHDKERGRLNMTIALTVAILTTFMAVTKIKDDNIVQAMQSAQSAVVDTWNQYQAKRIRQALTEDSLAQIRVLRAIVPPASRLAVDKVIQDDQRAIQHYDKDKKDLSAQAKQLQANYDALNNRDDQFDLSDALLTMALALLAMAALTAKRFLLYIGWVLMAFGILMGLAGFAQWHLHPDFIIQFLT